MGDSTYTEGQRWISEPEPELGLGTLLKAEGGHLRLLFHATGEIRQYARENAPLKRVRFRIGDRISNHEDLEVVVDQVTEDEGLLTYHGEGLSIPEAQLSDRIRFSRPEDRLLNGHADDLAAFDLRRRCSEHRFQRDQAPHRGFIGGRVDLIPHQLYIAQEVSQRYAPRVLLADEVGLGKTIEACLILHQLLLSGRAERVLILVPESLVHQWFVELLRKFNLWVNLFDEARCQSINQNQPDANPFLDDQFVLCATSLLADSPIRLEQAIEAGWDLLIVDEAHHLEWTEAAPSPVYQAVEALARQTEGLLLLTATPEQLGPESHFARLRLLDPERYSCFKNFHKQAEGYESTADLAEALVEGRSLSADEQTHLRELMKGSVDLKSESGRSQALSKLLDLHGPGRVVFRNTRAAISGFPQRRAHLIPLEPIPNELECLDRLATEFAADAGDAALRGFLQLDQDPRIRWLAQFIQALQPEKVLLICHTKEKALAVDHSLRQQINAKTAVFHEDLPLIQRDRNAAWFAEEEGAQLLICSEIGSEGRNFQFAHHLVMFDLPINPELVEQRIGRLDRIGQTQEIQIHIPFVEHSPQEVVAQWYHQALDALENSLEGGRRLYEQFGDRIHDFALEYSALPKDESEAERSTILESSRRERLRMAAQLKAGRNRLQELSSFQAAPAAQLKDAIRTDDQAPELESLMSSVFDHYGVHVEELAARTYRLDASGVITDAFPAIPKEGMVATYDRARALAREDVSFLTWDHPIVTGALDLILSSERGNSCFAIRRDQEEPGLMVEAIFELTTMAPGKWHADRFLPRTPIHVAVNHKLEPVPIETIPPLHSGALQNAPPYRLMDNESIRNELLPAMIARAQTQAQTLAEEVRASRLAAMQETLSHEIERLTTLAGINDHVRPIELELAQAQAQALNKAIREATIRLDSIRVLWNAPDEK